MTSPFVLLTAWNLHPKKELGQNFIKDRSAAEMIAARAGIREDDIALEIGAGLGALTMPVAGRAEKVYAVEKDRRIAELLKTELLANGSSNVVLVQDDILKVDIERISKSEGRPLFIIGNIPYNISSQILVQLIMKRKYIRKAVLMFQKELASRIIAKPGNRAYGRLAVMLGYCAEMSLLANLKASAFFPRPSVDSVVLDILFKEHIDPSAKDEDFFFKVIKAAFSKRRKTLKNSLAGAVIHIDAKAAGQELIAAGIDPIRRCETLSVGEFVTLSNRLYDTGYR